MTRRLSLIVAAALLFGISCRPVFAQDEVIIEHQGIDRRALLYRPSGMDGKRPLLVYLHGGRPKDWKNHTLQQIDALADRESIITAYPEAIGFRWNYAEDLKDPQKVADVVIDDLGFIQKLIQKLIEENAADASRLYHGRLARRSHDLHPHV